MFTPLLLFSFFWYGTNIKFDKYAGYSLDCASIQLMHSFEVDIRICQPENSDVHQGEAEVNITFEG